MAILKITRYGEKVLHQKTVSVTNLGPDIQKLILDMYDTMYAANGVGLAAPQVGLGLRLAVINVTPDEKQNQFVIINPQLIKKEGQTESEEGCLSLPGVGGARVKRAAKVVVRALNEKGLPIEITADGLLAVCLQHEIDHLDGRMIIDRSGIKRRFEMLWAIRRLKKEKLW